MMNIYSLKKSVTLAFVFLVAACGRPSAKVDVTPDSANLNNPTPDEVALNHVSQANNEFATDLFRTVAESDPDNLVISPLSIMTAFSMVQAGASGETLEEMKTSMHYGDMAIEGINSGHRILRDRIHAQTDQDRGYTLSIANRLWGEQTMNFLSSYVDVTREQYGAELVRRDIISGYETVRTEINEWVEEQTHDQIRNLFPPNSINPESRLVLANAIYFKGTWKTEFDPELTESATFTLADGGKHPVDMMQMRDAPFLFADLEAENVKVLSIPYEGEEVSMVFVLPSRTSDLATLEQGLSMEQVDAWIDAVEDPRDLDVQIPRFKMTKEMSLRGVMSRLGMRQVFTSEANLAGMNGERNLYVSAAMHKAFIEVNEEGTEAAAATGISVGITSVQPDRQEFVADRPFLYFIRDDVTGAILFIGRVAQPSGE